MPSRLVYGRLFVAGALLTLLVLPGRAAPVSDSPARLGVAHWLWTGQPPLEGLETTAPLVLTDRAGHSTPWYGIGHSLVLLPADVLATLAGARAPADRFVAVQYLVFPVVNGLVVAAAAALLTSAGVGVAAASASALALAFCSTLLWHFQNNQENPLQFLLLLVALTSAFQWERSGKRQWLVLMGACLGFELLIRLPNIVDVAIVSALPLLGARRRAYLREFAISAAPGIAAGLAGDRLYHFARFGEWTSTYMHMKGELARALAMPVPPGFPFSNDFWTGMTGPFFSLQKSVFLFDPLLLVAGALAAVSWRATPGRIRTLASAAAAGILLSAAAHATFYNWSAQSGWGDRFLASWVWVGALLVVPLLIERGVKQRAVLALCGVAFALQAISLVLPSWVEEAQLQTTDFVVEGLVKLPDDRFDHFIIGQRISNIASIAGGSGAVHPPILLVAAPLNSLPAWAAVLVRVGWCLGAIVLAWHVRRTLRLARQV